MTQGPVVIAIGGNSLISSKMKKSVEDQYEAICATVRHIADVIESGRQVCVTHGNGPQVGFILLRSELARQVANMHSVPLVSCVADTQGALGWQIQQALSNELRRRGFDKRGNSGKAVTVVTQVRVAQDDPGFANPDKYIGEFYDDVDIDALRTLHPDWIIKKDSDRGWRRVVPSPEPVEIIEIEAIQTLLAQGFNVIAVGGGGIPVIRAENGDLRGVDAVIDKDLATLLLAAALGTELLIISTGVDKVSIHFGKPEQQNLGQVTSAELKRYADEGHFPPGSMGPKVKAALGFLAQGGKEVIITCPENLKAALTEGGGTHVVA